jgi:hypothetical protein
MRYCSVDVKAYGTNFETSQTVSNNLNGKINTILKTHVDWIEFTMSMKFIFISKFCQEMQRIFFLKLG